MHAIKNSIRGRRTRCLLGALAAAASLVAGVNGAAQPGVSQTAADTAGATATGDNSRFAVGSPAMIQAEAIAVKYWNTAPCGGVVNVSWAPLDPTLNGASTWWNPVSAYGNAAANIQCAITLNQVQDFDWPMFCTVMVHEIGHLVGQQHSTDQASVMYPTYITPIAECKVAPAAAALGPAPVAARTASSSGLRAGTAHKAHSHHKRAHRRHHAKKHA